MSEELIEEIDIDLIEDEIYNPLESCELFKKELYQKGILQSGEFSKGSSSGKFEDDLWVVPHILNSQYHYIDFSSLEELRFVDVCKDDILVIKCWVAKNLIDSAIIRKDGKYEGNYKYAQSKYLALVDFMKATNNFSEDFIDEKNGLGVKWYFDKFDVEEQTVWSKVYSVIHFIHSSEDYFLEKHGAVGTIYLEQLEACLKNLTPKTKSRALPRTRDIMLFDHYIKRFFSDETVKEDEKNIYYPIFLWWKITNIIPMRPSEFCYKIPRQCLVKEDDNYYLKIGRIKQKADTKRRLLPVLDRLKITKDIYELIDDYIKRTEEYGASDTLISYRAIIHFKKIKVKKINSDKFSLKILDRLIKNFYSEVIKNKYKEFGIKQMIKPGDTRHFAFTSLLLQGVAPPYIAIMGGHRSLKTLDNYTCSSSYYADSEIVKYVNTMLIKNKRNSVDNKNIIDIVSRMPSKCPKDISSCIPMYDIGFCMADFSKDPCSCEEETYCFKCSKWWCEPSKKNAKYLIEKVKSEEIRPRRKAYEKNVEFLLDLFRNVGLEIVDGEMVVNEEECRELRRMALNVRSDIESIASDITMINRKLIDGIEDKPLVYLDNILNLISDNTSQVIEN